jgi:hypothetical protein
MYVHVKFLGKVDYITQVLHVTEKRHSCEYNSSYIYIYMEYVRNVKLTSMQTVGMVSVVCWLGIINADDSFQPT